jgi:hypothetical protein
MQNRVLDFVTIHETLQNILMTLSLSPIERELFVMFSVLLSSIPNTF